MNQPLTANRATHVHAYATNAAGVIVEITTTAPSGAETVLPRFWLSRPTWAAMISIVDNALAIPPEDGH